MHLFWRKRCVAAFEAMHFSVRSFGCALFYFTGKEVCIMEWYFIVTAIVGLIIHIALASLFAGYAETKGYEKGAFFALCFFFGVIGYCVVGALPDKVLYEMIAEFSHVNAPVEEAATTWVCNSCHTENSINYSQCKKCGKFRS